MIFLRTALLAIAATSSVMSAELRGAAQRKLDHYSDCVNDDAWKYNTNVDTGCTAEYPNCVALDGSEVGGYAPGQMCMGDAAPPACTNTAPFGDQDSGCPANAPVCVLADDSTPPAHGAGVKCITPVCMQSSAFGGIDKGCSADLPLCVLKDGSEPADWSIGFECVRCRNSDPSNSGVHVDFGCSESEPFCIAANFLAEWETGDTCSATKPQRGAFATGVWTDDTIHILSEDLTSIRSFSTGSGQPNGIATDGQLIYSGHFSSQEVVAYNLAGEEQFRWSGPLSGLQGMDLVEGELAIYRGGSINFFEADTGVLIRSIPGIYGTEGIAYDGKVIWKLTNGGIVAVSPADGSNVSTIPNAASGCDFNGTGITSSGPDELTLACTNGDWFRVSSLDGSVTSSGNNGLSMYGLKLIPSH